jgi:hypothetical protein
MMTTQNIGTQNQKRCSDPDCELFDGDDDSPEDETEDFMSQLDFATKRKPKKPGFGIAQVSSARVAVPVATVAPASTQGTPPPVQKPQFITTGKAPKVLGRFTGGEANPSTKRGRGK